MPLDSSLVGRDVGQIETVCDTRWAMSYAAGIPDERPELYDTTGVLTVHPLFPVAPEWKLLTTHKTVPPSMTHQEVVRGVHASHDLVLLRPVPVGERLTIRALVVAVDRRPAGAGQRTLLEATGADGEVVWRTMLTSVFRGVDLRGDPASVDVGWPTAPAAHPDGEHAVAIRTSLVRPVDAHVYTECARIWNPIHTDVAIARAAGLADPILHGTATLSRAVSVCAELTEVPLVDVRRVGATFAAPVALGSTIEIRLLSHHDGVTSFDVINDQGRPAIRHGYLETQPVGLPQDRGRSIDHTARGFD